MTEGMTTILCVRLASIRRVWVSRVLTRSQGHVGQDTLSVMIRKDELGPSRGRRRFYDPFATYQDTTGKLTYPPGGYPP